MKRRDSIKNMTLASFGASIFLESCYDVSREKIARSLTRYEYGRTPEEKLYDDKLFEQEFFSKAQFEDALIEYEGAVLVVSHDRYFISRVANKIVEIRDGDLVVYRGDYAYYREKKAEEAAAADAARAAADQEAKRKANRDKQKAKAEARKQKVA